MSMSFPVLNVTVESDGKATEITVGPDNRDAVRYDLTRNRKGWPASSDAPMLFMTFLAWSALHRSGFPISGNVEEALDQIVSVEPAEGEDGPIEFVPDPTIAGHSPA